ncbi:uncharacterized protein F4822DRAFT_384563 [Hypoxylon trugodes]|uniref:uncharacterized protein n=1 Tax=Hypoxylon trugodes TaxID=326681 RepID=UPI0021983ECC|nr:uncharacterized protein F4822DRAFT_384563 [Hypoxylon trugodes]KAI1393410.1 hypothetical protein F4822DRAFT_384563 [Hypoxylon trugodes]
MENPRAKARASWGEAQKIRTHMMDKLSNFKKERGTTNATSRFEEVEQTMAEFRLACLNVIANDFEYAVDKNVEVFLWQAHTFLNSEYRKVMSRLLSQNQVVVRRKLEKLYRQFLRLSQSFYRVYIQKMSGRFYIPELYHIARDTDIEPTETPALDAKPPSQIRELILRSCQITLVHLGDLFRYRCQMSEKLSNSNVNFDRALSYYGLANALDPNDGSAHHQLAVLYQLQARHLEIVYHFHRSICVANPHELGLYNLEREFNGLENSSAARKGPIKDPCETMITWFLRLHTYFFKGEPFTQQGELENEVLHRIETTAKSDADEAVLRKMIIINIAAYDVALERVKSSWSIQGSQSAQFLLRFNIRTVLILLRVLKKELLDESATSPADGNESGDLENAGSPICFSRLLTKLFPLIRIYISWIYVCRADANNYREFLEPYISEVYRLLADSLTLLNMILDQAAITTSSKYLLLEDTEAIGLRPFSDQTLPLFVQVGHVSDPDEANNQKPRKPRQRVFGRQHEPSTETIWRMRDIVYCGVLLAACSSYPLEMTLKHHEGRDIECWDFTDEVSKRGPIDEASMSRMLNKLKLAEIKTKPEDLAQDVAQRSLSPAPLSADILEAPSHEVSNDTTKSALQRPRNKGKAVEELAPSSLLDTDLSGDSEMVDMVNKLLDPTEESRPQSSHTQADTSYGMNTTMANDIFGRLATGSAQPSPSSKAIPSLPWGYFYAPMPQRSSSQGNNQLAPDGDYVPRSAHGQLGDFDSSSYLRDLSTPFRQAQKYSNTGEGIAHRSPGPLSAASAFHSHQSKGSRDSLEASRSEVLDSLASAIFGQHGLAPTNMQRSESYSSRPSASPYLAPQVPSETSSKVAYPRPGSSNPANYLGSSNMERSVSQRSSTANHQSPPGSAGWGGIYGGGFQEHRSTHLHHTSNPDELGFPPLGSKGQPGEQLSSGPSQRQNSPWLQNPARSGSTLAFSHPSSLFGGTPAANLGGSPKPALSNGNHWNAGTPFGQLGTGHKNRDDPARRSQNKNILGVEDESRDYNMQAFHSPLLGNNNSKMQRPK